MSLTSQSESYLMCDSLIGEASKCWLAILLLLRLIASTNTFSEGGNYLFICSR